MIVLGTLHAICSSSAGQVPSINHGNKYSESNDEPHAARHCASGRAPSPPGGPTGAWAWNSAVVVPHATRGIQGSFQVRRRLSEPF